MLLDSEKQKTNFLFNCIIKFIRFNMMLVVIFATIVSIIEMDTYIKVILIIALIGFIINVIMGYIAVKKNSIEK